MKITQTVNDNLFGAKTMGELKEQAEKAFDELTYKPVISATDDEVVMEIEESPAGMTALVQLGNICLTQHRPEEAEKYYRTAMENDPDNFVAITNVGAACMDGKRYDEAITLFDKSLEVNGFYVNTYYGKALAYLQKEDYQTAFDVCMDGSQKTMQVADNNGSRSTLMKLMISLAETLVSKTDYKATIDKLATQLKQADGKDIQISADEHIEHSATLKVAPAHSNEAHEIKYQPALPFTDYLVMRKLIRLQMVQQARQKGKNKVVEYTSVNEGNFNRRFGMFFSNMSTKMNPEQLAAFMKGVGHGFSYQLISFVLDLIVEDKIYFDYPELRPLQLLALTRQEQESLEAIRPSKELSLMPQTVVSASRMMILIASLYFANLYGVNIVSEYHGNEKEYKKVDDLYERFVDYLENDPQPGDEYGLVAEFVEELGFADLITIHGESGLIL